MQKKATYYPNMDIVRYILAFGVLVAHFNILTRHSIPFFISSFDSVGGFFAISGFLMYPSFQKSQSLRRYLTGRARKILPSYLFIVILAAVAGIFLSSLPAIQYVLSPDTWKYLLANTSFLNWLHPSLPGVFDGPGYVSHNINGSLWTMKVEWALYLSIPLFAMLINRLRCRGTLTAVSIIAASVIYRLIFLYLYIETKNQIYEIFGRQFFGQLSYFYCGVLVYLNKDLFIRSIRYILPAAIILYILIPTTNLTSILVHPILIAALVLSVSLAGKTVPFLRHNDNLSYNIYLFHFPVIQTCIYAGINNCPVYISFTCVLLATLILSFLSARFIDRPFNKKPRIS